MTNKPRRILVAGGVALGTKAAAKARRQDPDAEIVIYTDEALISYAGCGEPYYVSGEISNREKLLARTPEQFESALNVAVRPSHRVERIDPDGNTVTVTDLTSGQSFEDRFDALVIATGAFAIVPPIPGRELDGVHTLRTIPDTDAIRERVDSGRVKNAVIVGGGFIGLEMVESLVRRGVKVTLVERLPQVAPPYDEEVSHHIVREMEKHGVRTMIGAALEEIVDGGGGSVGGAVVDGERIEADMVLLSVGVRPNTRLAADAGVQLGKTGAIQVNEYLQTNYPHIYAGGDCAEVTHRLTGEPMWIPLGSTANRQGRVIGINAAGGAETFPGVMGTGIFRVFDLNVARTGLSERELVDRGFDFEAAVVPVSDLPHYMPGGKTVVVKLMADKKTRRLLGAQVWGEGKVDKTIDTLATAMTFNATVDQVQQLDLAYAPPFAPPLGNAVTAANVLQNKLDKNTEGALPMEVLKRRDHGDIFFLDVRNPEEIQSVCVEKCVNIPLPQLGARADELPREGEIITSCGVGLRAAMAYRKLKRLGFEKVRYMDGGIQAFPAPIKKS